MISKQSHGFWGPVATPADLVNVAGSANNSGNLALGDLAYSIAPPGLWQCDDPTAGAAVWSQPGGGGGAGSYEEMSLNHLYTEAVVPVVEVAGGGVFDGSLVGSATAYFTLLIEPVMSNVPGDEIYVNIYDMGPKAGPLGVPQLVVGFMAGSNGLQCIEGAVTVDAAPGLNKILPSARIYEVTITSNATSGDIAIIRSCGIEVR